MEVSSRYKRVISYKLQQNKTKIQYFCVITSRNNQAHSIAGINQFSVWKNASDSLLQQHTTPLHLKQSIG